MFSRVFYGGHSGKKFTRHVPSRRGFRFVGFSVQPRQFLFGVDYNAAEAVTSAFDIKTAVHKSDKFVFGANGNIGHLRLCRNIRKSPAFPVTEESECFFFCFERLVFRAGKAVNGSAASVPRGENSDLATVFYCIIFSQDVLPCRSSRTRTLR